MFKNFLITSPPLKLTYWIIRVDLQIFLDQIRNFFSAQAVSLDNLSWFSNIPWSGQEIIRFWVMWLDRSKSTALYFRFSLSNLSILSKIIGSIYLRICNSFNIHH